MTTRLRRPVVAAALCLLVLGWLAGCETDERAQARRHAQLVAADPDDPAAADLFHVDVTLYRRYAGAKWLLDKDHVFTVKDESHVKAEVVLQNLRPERTYSVHLVWIKPDGSEMFRRYAEVRRQLIGLPAEVQPDSAGALPASFTDPLVARFGEKRARRVAERLAADPDTPVPVNEVRYKKAVDFGYEKPDIELGDDPAALVDSRLNISREKQRDLGEHLLRIYLDRRLLQEVPFTIQEND